MANRLNVSRCTISRLRSRKASDTVNDVPPRKQGTGQKKKYGSREVTAIERTIEKNRHLTCRELKMRMPKLLKNLSARTVRRILDIDLDRPARVAPKSFSSLMI